MSISQKFIVMNDIINAHLYFHTFQVFSKKKKKEKNMDATSKLRWSIGEVLSLYWDKM